MKKAMALTLCCLLISLNGMAKSVSNDRVYELWDDQPCPNSGSDYKIKKAGGYPYDADWEQKSYPIGNGYMGANVFGRTDSERIQITEKTLCNEGLYTLGGLTSFLELNLDIAHDDPQHYRRRLNLNKAILYVTYSQDGVDYHREYFMSYPDNVCVIKITASKKGSVSLTARAEIPYLSGPETENPKTGSVAVQKDTLVASGTIPKFSINYEAQVKVIPQGGQLAITNDDNKRGIRVTRADSVVLLVAAGTNYKLDKSVFLEENTQKKLDPAITPHRKISALINKASAKGFEKLKQRHLADYQSLFSRVQMYFSSQIPQKTETLLENYRQADTPSRYLEELMFHYGRYLLISSSRKGTLPSGLQGIWSQYKVTPWTGGYWHNINVQMNYWGALSTNLAETFTPYIEFFNAYHPKATQNADRYLKQHNPSAQIDLKADNGWTIGTGATPYKISGPGGHSGPGTGGFTSKLFWEYYEYTRDINFLRSTGYPILYGMTRFLAQTVKPADNGLLLVDPSASPEQRHKGTHYQSIGTTFDQGFIWENHNDLLKAAAVLNIEDPFLDTVRKQIPLLDPILVGKSGQIKEYREEVYYGDIGDKKHRHVSHLCPLYPGTLINSKTKAWLQAAIVSLDLRGNNTTGWAMAHRMNLRARTKDGEKTHQVYAKFIRERTLPNLWTTHPPFQIDGNFGCMAGVVEMLLQSHEGFIEPLAALPQAWHRGQFQGLVARGNFAFSARWNKGRASSFEVVSNAGGTCRIKYTGIGKARIKDGQGKAVPLTRQDANIIHFETLKGHRYRITL